MANLFQSTSSGLAELKNFYQGPIRSQLNDDIPIHRAIEKDKKSWSGYQVVKPVKVRRNQGIGAVSDGGALPSIGRQTTVQALILAKYNYLRFGITGPMIKASQSDIGSFVRSASYELEQGYLDLKSDLNRQYSWNGNGKIATVNTAANGSTTLVIAGREAVEAALKFIDVGLVFDVYDSTFATKKASSISVNAIASGTPTGLTATLTLDQAVTVAATDVLVRAGSYGNEVQGLLTALDGATSSIYNIDRSTYISYQGNVIDLDGAQLTLDKMQQAYNEGLRRGGSVKYDAIYTDFDSLRYYQKLLTVDKRYSNTIQGDGGFASKDKFYLEFNGVPLVPDKDAPQRMMFISAEAFTNFVLAEMEFADETGSMYIAQTGVDSLEVRIRMFNNLFNEKPNSCAVLEDYVSP